MIFHEIYSAYYNTVAKILGAIIEGNKGERELQGIVLDNAFTESVLTILPSLKGGRWQLCDKELNTPLSHIPTMPLTTLEKGWLKAISLDPRIKLFGVEFKGLDEVEPLFTSEDYHIYDKYSDGDPYDDEEYVRQFKVILDAIRRGTQIKFEMTNRYGKIMFVRCRPLRLEYSEKDDKFRVITSGWHSVATVNMAKIRSCVHYEGNKLSDGFMQEIASDTAVLKVTDERNALERVMLHFAHFEKQAERLDEKTYLLKVNYSRMDEPEIVIRILSFGPLVEVIGSVALRELVIEKLKKQKNCGLF